MSKKPSKRFIDNVKSSDSRKDTAQQVLAERVASRADEKSLMNERVLDDLAIIEGHFACGYVENGKKTRVFEKNNLRTTFSRKIVAHLISDGTIGFDNSCTPINLMRIGGAVLPPSDPQLANPLPPDENDTDIVYREYVSEVRPGDLTSDGFPRFSFIFPNSPFERSVEYEFRFGEEEGNVPGQNPTVYLAAGIFIEIEGEQILFCTVTYPQLQKTDTRELFYSWTIGFRI